MRLPGSVREALQDALARERCPGGLTALSPVGGGCINNGARVDTDDGERFFLKWNASAPAGMFEAEVDGLRALGVAAETIDPDIRPRVPRPIAHGGDPCWLLMEWIPSRARAPDTDERLGRGLALLHGSSRGRPTVASGPAPIHESVEPEPTIRGSEPSRGGSDGEIACGWHRDNWIGSLPQSNRTHRSWAAFWRDERIVPQLVRAREGGHLAESLMDELVERIPAALSDVEAGELLHGDLWGGNTLTTDGGASALIDPAVYRGDGEVDLAMTELFGGFGAGFYDAYGDVRGVSEAYASHRRALYQLYYLLVHVNLFGAGYVERTRRAAEEVVTALS